MKYEGDRYSCPCCLYKTLSEIGGYEICPVCFWEDDGVEDPEERPDEVEMREITYYEQNRVDIEKPPTISRCVIVGGFVVIGVG